MSPTYYAGREVTGEYELRGSGFLGLGANAVGIMSFKNDDPLENRNSTEISWLFNIEILSDTQLIVKPRVNSTHTAANYLGGIVSADRETTYWINETRPLP